MHELSIATSLVSLATEVVEEAGHTEPIECIRIRVGDLAGVVIEALEFSWDVATAGTRCEGARLEIERVPARVSCPACDHVTVLGHPPRFRCGACGAATANVVAGRELDLVSLDLEDPSEPDAPVTDSDASDPDSEASHFAAHR